ncbi:putative T7SS-secreted protein [Amycolatopsis sp. NPDC050768]|uniref:putative T7SS-secreted protein n=1 Tax=Amycolatopsis sp. NPDC050768 TaxID=3154839 RepID=UPI0033E2469A
MPEPTEPATRPRASKAIDTRAWTGPAAHAFHDKCCYEPAKWCDAADSMLSAADALDHAGITGDLPASGMQGGAAGLVRPGDARRARDRVGGRHAVAHL